jgi:KUP system potassium uptake protein
LRDAHDNRQVKLRFFLFSDGRAELYKKIAQSSVPFEVFLKDVSEHCVHLVSGTAVFLTSTSQFTSPSLLHHYKHNRVLHQKVVLLTIVSVDFPAVRKKERVRVDSLGNGFYRLIARYGFMETPNVPSVLNRAYDLGLIKREEPISYYLGRETLLATGSVKMMKWRKRLFAFLSRNSQSETNYFGVERALSR